jgi:hypothetical protein
MRNVLTLLALMVSVSGIMVSLAREEVRCYLALSSASCQHPESSSAQEGDRNLSPSMNINQSTSPREKTEAVQENSQPVVNTTQEASEISKVKEDIPDLPAVADPNNNTPEEPVSENPISPPVTSQPVTNDQQLTKSVELEVIPPPEQDSP